MSDEAGIVPSGLFASRRFFLIGFLPMCVAVACPVVLRWAGAPGSTIDFRAAWHTAAGLSTRELVIVAVGIVLLAVLLAPLQTALVHALQGSWPSWLGGGVGRWWHLRRKRRLKAAATLAGSGGAGASEAEIRRAGAAGSRLRRSYPSPDDLVRPTALGNALAAMGDTAGRDYGMDAVVAWPRLYPVLGPGVKTIVDDHRDMMDARARLAISAAAAAIASAVLLARSGWWLLLVLVPAVVAVLSYHGAAMAARDYGESVQVAFDMHRLDLLDALRVEPPRSLADEKRINRELCDLWRQRVPPDLKYRSDPPSRPAEEREDE
jgi:hypothetical protein